MVFKKLNLINNPTKTLKNIRILCVKCTSNLILYSKHKIHMINLGFKYVKKVTVFVLKLASNFHKILIPGIN